MRKHASLFLLLLLHVFFLRAQIAVQPPDKIYGDLFVKVQMDKIFADGKTFVDCIPKKNPA
jgi:alpha,alpha-trehalase